MFDIFYILIPQRYNTFQTFLQNNISLTNTLLLSQIYAKFVATSSPPYLFNEIVIKTQYNLYTPPLSPYNQVPPIPNPKNKKIYPVF